MKRFRFNAVSPILKRSAAPRDAAGVAVPSGSVCARIGAAVQRRRPHIGLSISRNCFPNRVLGCPTRVARRVSERFGTPLVKEHWQSRLTAGAGHENHENVDRRKMSNLQNPEHIHAHQPGVLVCQPRGGIAAGSPTRRTVARRGDAGERACRWRTVGPSESITARENRPAKKRHGSGSTAAVESPIE